MRAHTYVDLVLILRLAHDKRNYMLFYNLKLFNYYYFQAVPTHLPVVLPLDLSDLNSLPDCVTQALAIFGHVDILIHNGGISNRGDVISTDVDVAMKIMMVNYFGQMVLTKGKFLKQP